MGRCRKDRCCRLLEDEKVFKPLAVPMSELEKVYLRADEFEAIRLCDLDGKNQTEAGDRMHISRGTVQRLLLSGRAKIAGALLQSQALCIENK